MIVVGIETSCDETGVAAYASGRGLLAHALYSQTEIHARYGGVVPELASRDHVRKTLPLLEQVLAEAGLGRADIGGIAYTAGPGLVGALLVGAAVARSLGFALGVPVLGVHHLESHLLAPMLEPDPPPFPFVALLVSGGHTQLIDVAGVGRYRLLGDTLDDAAGEAFDKFAKLLGLGYPGGAALARLAEGGRPDAHAFPRPMLDRPGLDFSFSGLKTAGLLALKDAPDDPQRRADLAASYQEAIIDTLVAKCARAVELTGHRRLVIAGGVSANRRLRARLDGWAEERNARVHYPRPEFCADNGAMIAYAGWTRLAAGECDGPGFQARPRWRLEELRPPPED